MCALRRRFLPLFLCCLFPLMTPGESRAALMFTWSFDEPTGFVSPSETVFVNATIQFDAASDSISFSAAPWASPEVGPVTAVFNPVISTSEYVFEFGTGLGGVFLYEDQFAGMTFDGGDSFSFLFGRFVPVAPVVGQMLGLGPGVGGAPGLGLRGTSFPGDAEVLSDNAFVRTVVPVPPALLLLWTAIAGLGLVGWRRRAS